MARRLWLSGAIAVVAVVLVVIPSVAIGDLVWSSPTDIDGSTALGGVACSGVNQCAAVDASGAELTFNPASLGSPAAPTVRMSAVLDGVTCLSATQCVAVDTTGYATTFDPTGASGPTSSHIDGSIKLLAVACPQT